MRPFDAELLQWNDARWRASGQMQARIVGESRHGRETVVRVKLLRAVPVEVAEEFVRQCPYYVAGTFAVLGR